VGQLHPGCCLAVFDEISIRHLIRPPFRHASKELLETWPHLPELTKGQRLDAPYLREPSLPWVLAAVTVQPRCLLSSIALAVFNSLLLGDAGGEAGAAKPTAVVGVGAVDANALNPGVKPV
jgi:hypothetical protein